MNYIIGSSFVLNRATMKVSNSEFRRNAGRGFTDDSFMYEVS